MLFRVDPTFQVFSKPRTPFSRTALHHSIVHRARPSSTFQSCHNHQVWVVSSRALSEEPLVPRLPLACRSTSQRRYFSSTRPLPNQANPRDDLPSQEESRRSPISKRFTHVMDNVQSNIFIAGQRLNDLTGYSGIEALKKDIERQEGTVEETRISLQKAREAYAQAIALRSTSQRESNELLQRKHAWTPNDLERFTTLYRSDHANELAETAARDTLTASERQAEEAAGLLSKSILARYHEEQIWSDKIRRMSTWGTWGLMGVNVLLFLVFQIGVEPWRRRRLVKGFEDKVVEALEREDEVVKDRATEGQMVASGLTGEVAPPTLVTQPEASDREILSEVVISDGDGEHAGLLELSTDSFQGHGVASSTIQGFKDRARDLFSERQILVRQVDLTTAVMEGVAGGVAFVGLLVLLLRPK